MINRRLLTRIFTFQNTESGLDRNGITPPDVKVTVLLLLSLNSPQHINPFHESSLISVHETAESQRPRLGCDQNQRFISD